MKLFQMVVVQLLGGQHKLTTFTVKLNLMPHENVHLQLSSVDKIFVAKFTSAWFNAVVVLFVAL